MENSYCQKLLENELNKRKNKNPYYSIRSFARDLGIGSTTLSDVLASKRNLSKKNIEKVAKTLNLSSTELNLMEGHTSRVQTKQEIERLQLEEDEFNLIAQWHHLAILSLAKLENCKSSPKWLANRLGITTQDAVSAVNTLKRLGFVDTKGGFLTRNAIPLSTSRDIPSEAIKRYHKSTLELAAETMEEVDVSLREFSSITMPANLEHLQEAKDILMKTKRRISALLEKGDCKEVYQLSFQLFPLTKVNS